MVVASVYTYIGLDPVHSTGVNPHNVADILREAVNRHLPFSQLL